jgi:hypothetical protein
MTDTAAKSPTLADLGEPWPKGVAPYLDQPDAIVDDMGPIEQAWHRDGYVILPKFVPGELLDNYCDAWRADNVASLAVEHGGRPMGWPYNTPYMHVPAVRDLCCYAPLADVLQRVIGEPCGVHLNLTGWRSTQRNWHQDGYLNPDSNGDWYAAVWIALDDIDAHAGPFQFVPGSHRHFPVIRHDKMRAALTPEEAESPDWPTHSERILTPLFEDELRHDRVIPHEFVAKRGDVLVWHARLLHRGSAPLDPRLERRALIAHFSGIHHRPDMPTARRHEGGGFYFPIDEGGHR